MRHRTPETLNESARLTREMTALAERFLDGKATREEVESWARMVDHHKLHSPAANDLHTCLCNIDVMRPQDLTQHLDAVRVGGPIFDDDIVASVKLSIEEVARRVGRPTLRFWIEGLGEFEGVRFASPATGRPFFAVVSLYHPHDPGIHTVGHPSDPQEQAQVLEDLFDTLIIDLDDTGRINAPLPPTWKLLRLDDNVNTFVVASFTGYAKARAALTAYEAKMHKQSYWLEKV